MAQAQDLQKEHADAKGRKNSSEFKENDYVLISTKNLPAQAVAARSTAEIHRSVQCFEANR
jgi:hypothetical protein